LSAALRKDGVHEAVGLAGTSFLLTPIAARDGVRRVLWLEEPAGRVWTDPEKVTLALASQVLGRYLPAQTSAAEPAGRHDQARLQERMRDAAVMAGRVAHAFDNVLTGILGFAELTLNQSKDPTLQQYLSEVLQAAQNGVQLTQQLHLFHRCATAGTGPTRLAPLAADEEMRLLQVLDPHTTLTVTVPKELPAVALDSEPIRHILAQLLNNARESLAGSGTITVSARLGELNAATCAALYGAPRPGPCVEIIIADSGGGLSVEARQRLFNEPLFTTKPRHRGLGLAVVYRILAAHQGGFQLEAGPRGGTVARVFLPLATAGAAPSGQHRLAARSS
jgi:signal transduction histidine kinase